MRVAEAAVGSPEGVVREVIFPAAGQSTLEALAREARALGTPRSRRVHTAVRASYGSYYRRMMPELLAALEFRSNIGAHRPLLDALARISQTPMSIVGIASIITVHDCICEHVRCAFGAADFGLSRVSGGPGVGMPLFGRAAAARQTGVARAR